MIKLNIFIFLILFVFSKNLSSTNIVVIDVENLVDTNNQFIEIINDIEISQNNFSEILEKEELRINNLYNEIEDSKILLDQNSINKMIENYNFELNNLNKKIENFNKHYNDQIIRNRKLIFEQIIVLVENYAKDNNIDLIIDSNSYLIASNSINITDVIKKGLNNINLKLEFEKFEKN